MADPIVPVIDRRQFLQRTALLALGCACAPPLLSCGDPELVIPCLGPAAAPDPVAGMTYIRASEIGCALDCNLQNGRNKYTGGNATDDAPRINAAMAAATAANPITLIIDGSALISGLFLPAGGHWAIAGLGCGTGFFVKKGTNNDGIHNGLASAAVPSDPGPPAPARGSNVSLSNFTLNGNQGNGSSGDSTTGKHQGSNTVWYFGINLMNLDNITIQSVVVVNTPAYLIRLSNVGNVTVSGCPLHATGDNTDGLHFDGPANDVSIQGCDFKTGDDAIALNCPEGYSGNISRVSVSNCTFDSISMIRLYTANAAGKFNISTVNVSNCSGTLSGGGFIIGIDPGSNPNSVDGLSITDCTITAPAVLSMLENYGSIALKNVTFIPLRNSDVWSKLEPNHTCAILRPNPGAPAYPITGASLSFENVTIKRQSNIPVDAVQLEKGQVIGNLTFNGLAVADAGSFSPIPELISANSASIGQLVLDSLNNHNIKGLLSAGGFSSVKSVSGAGVLATGWQFSDSVMADNVPYISATTGLPSIKINGVVVPYRIPPAS
jgi:hypothetical protein